MAVTVLSGSVGGVLITVMAVTRYIDGFFLMAVVVGLSNGTLVSIWLQASFLSFSSSTTVSITTLNSLSNTKHSKQKLEFKFITFCYNLKLFTSTN